MEMSNAMLVLLALAATATAGPISQESDKCSITCTPNSKFNYKEGTTYIYDYNVETSTLVGGATTAARLTVSAKARLHVLAPCEMALTLTDTRLMTSDANGNMVDAQGSRAFATAVEDGRLRLSWQDGKVEAVCPRPGTPDAVTNFRKAVLSALQNSMDDLTQSQNLTETDVAGACRTAYTAVSNGYLTTTVSKAKDVLSCTGRHQHDGLVHTAMPYDLPSELQALPVMKTTAECTQEIGSGLVKSAICTETHVFRPFAHGDSGAQTSVKQSLTYSSYAYESLSLGPAAPRADLAFTHGAPETPLAARQAVESRLREICDTSRAELRPESAGQFARLAAAMRPLAQAQLEDIHRLLKTKSICPDNDKTYKSFLDALPVVRSDAAVALMTSLAASGDVSASLAKAWAAQLAFLPRPTQLMVNSAKALLDSDATRDDALLAVTAMVNNYCKGNAQCDQDPAVSRVMAVVEKQIGFRCNAKGDREQQVLLALRGLGNAGVFSRLAVQCLTSDEPTEVRVAAAQAFRRVPCDAKDNALWKTFEDANEDAELRVAAYLAIMRCPEDRTLTKMAASLKTETNDQVGAFVYSHLNNLKKTSDPHRQELAARVAKLVLNEEMDKSALKFSRHFEASVLINRLNLGFGAEAGLIWADDLPRAVSGNLTVDMFGQAVNLLDFGARAEGLETLLMKYFEEYLPEDMKTKPKAKMADFEASAFGRVFGHELAFLHSGAEMKMPSYLDLLIRLAKRQDVALTHSAKLAHISLVVPTVAGLPLTLDFDATGSAALTMSGKFDVRKLGSSPRSMDVHGEIKPSASVEMVGTMSMAALGTTAGLRMRNTLHTATAIKGRAFLARGQTLELELDAPQDKMEIFSASSKLYSLHEGVEVEEAGLNKDRVDMAQCSGTKLAYYAGVELCGSVSFPNATGIASAPWFPLTGPATAALTLHSRDSHSKYKLAAKAQATKKAVIVMAGFNTPGSKVDRNFLAEAELNHAKQTAEATLVSPWVKLAAKGALINNDKMKSISGSLVIDDSLEYAMTSEVKIDNSKTKMTISPLVELRRPGAKNMQLSGMLTLVTPAKSADIDLSLAGFSDLPFTIKASMQNSKKMRSLTAKVAKGDKPQLSVEASHQLSMMGKKAVIASLEQKLSVEAASKPLVNLANKVDYREGKSIKVDATAMVHKLVRKPINLKLSLVKNSKKRGDRYDVDAILKSSQASFKLDSFAFVKTSGLIATKHVLSYTIPRVAKDKVTLAAKLNDRSTKAYKKYSVKGNLAFAKNSAYNMALSAGLDHKKKHSAASVELKYGSNPKDKTKRIFLESSLTRKAATLKNAMGNFKMQAEAPEYDINFNVLGKHQHTFKALDSSINVNYGGKGKDLKAEVSLRDKSSKLTKMNGKASLSGFGATYNLGSSLEQKSAKQYSHALNIKGPGMKHNIITLYKNSKGNGHAFTTKLGLSGMRPLTLSGSINPDLRNLDISGEIQRGKAAYGFKSNTKVSKAPAGKLDLEVYYPARHMTLLLEGGKQKGKYVTFIETAWDAKKNPTHKLTFDSSAYMKKSKTGMSLGGDASLASPFAGMENLKAAFKYGSDDAQHDFSSKFSSKENAVMTSFNIKRPFSLKSIQMSADLKTPFEGLKVASIDVNHAMNPALKTIVSGKWEKENGKLVIEGENFGDMINRNFKVNADLKSTLNCAKNVKMSLVHADSNGKLNSKGALTYNGKSYGYSTNVNHAGKGWMVKNSGDLSFAMPSQKLQATWKHKNTDKYIKTAFAANMGKKEFQLDVDASHDLLNSGVLSGNLKMETPFKSMKRIDLSVSHKHAAGSIMTKALAKRNGKPSASTTLKFNGNPSNVNAEFDLATPFTEDISGKVNADFAKFPVTGQAVVSWAPKTKAVARSSLDISAADFNLDLTLKAPFANIQGKVNSKFAKFPVTGQAIVSWSPKDKAVVKGSLDIGSSQFDADVSVNSPFHKEVSAKVNAMFAKYPVTGMALVSWAPKTKAIIKGSADLKPSAFDIEMELNTPFSKPAGAKLNANYGSYPLNGLAQLSWAGKQKAVAQGSLNLRPSEFDIDMSLQSPYHKDIAAKLSSRHAAYPVTGLAEFSWAPKSKTTVEGSLDVANINDASAQLKMNTPFKGYRNIVLKASNKHQRGVHTSQLNLDFGVRKDFDIETNIAFNNNKKMMRMKMRTPYDEFKSLDTGFAVAGGVTNFDGSVDFEVLPALGKYQGNVNWQYADNMKGTFRVDTPLKNFPFFELSASSNNKDGLRMSTIRAEHSPNQVYAFNTKYAFEGPYSLEASINTPFPEYDNLGLTFKHNNNAGRLMTHGEVTYQPSKKIEADLNLDTSSNVEASLVLKTPFRQFRTSRMLYRHQGSMNDFSCHAEANAAGKSISTDASFKHGINTEGAFTFNSPITGLENVDISFNKRGNLNNARGNAIFSVNGKKAQASFNHRMSESSLKSFLSVNTPMTRPLKASVDHNGGIDSFTNKLSLNYGQNYDIDTVVSFDIRQPDISGSATLKAKLGGEEKTGRLTFSKTGLVEDMAFSGTASYNKKDVSLNGSWKLLAPNGIESAITLNTPFDNFRNLAFSLSHSGDLYNFNTETGLTYIDNQSINGKVQLASNGLEKINFHATLTTPFSALRSTQATFAHEYNRWSNTINGDASLYTTVANFGQGSVSYSKSGDLNNFSGMLSAKHGEQEASLALKKNGGLEDMKASATAKLNNEAIDVNGHLKTLDGFSGELKVKTPFTGYRNVGIKIGHKGAINNFKTEASVDYADNQNINGELNFANAGLRMIRMTADANTPFGSAKVALSHRYRDMTVRTVASFNDKTVSFDGSLRTDNGIEGEMKLKTPIRGYRNLGLTVSHRGEINDFTSKASVDYADNQNVIGEIKFSNDGLRMVKLSAEANTPFGSANIGLNHNYRDMSINTIASFNGKSFAINGALKTDNGIDGELKLKTPFRGYRNLGLTVAHRGQLNDFNSQASVDYADNKNVNGKIVFANNGIRSVSLSADVETPRELFGNGKLTLNHVYNQWRKTVSTTANLQSQLARADLAFSQSGGLKDLNVAASANLNGESLLNAKATNIYSPGSLNSIVSMDSAMTPTFELAINHNGDLNNFNSKVQGKFGIANMASVEANGNVRGNIIDGQAKIAYTTASFGANQAGITIHKEGSLGDFSVTTTGTLNNDKVTVNAAAKFDTEITGSLTVTSTIKGFRNVGMSFKHSGKAENFKTIVDITVPDNNRYSAKLDFYSYLFNRIQTNLEVRTPISGYEFNKVEYRHETNGDNLECYATVEYGTSKKITYEMKAAKTPSPSFSVTLKTPFTNYEELMAAGSLINNLPSSASVSGKINAGNGNIVTVNGNIDMSSDFVGSLKFTTPVRGFSNLGITVKHNGGLKNFKSDASVMFMDNKEITANVAFNMRHMIGSAKLSTPFQGFTNLAMSFKHTGNMENFDSEAKVMYMDNKEISAKASFNIPHAMGSISVATPFRGFRNIGMSFKNGGDITNFNAEANVMYMDNQEIAAKVSYNLPSVMGSVQVTTPFRGFRNIGMSFKHSGDITNFNSEAKVMYMDNKEISAKASFAMNRDLSGAVVISTPFEGFNNMGFNFKHSGDLKNFNCDAKIYNSNQAISGKVSFALNRDYAGSVQLSTPFNGFSKIGMSFKFAEEPKGFTGEGKVTYMDNKAIAAEIDFKRNGQEIIAVLKTPFQGYELTKYEYTSRANNEQMTSSTKYTYGNNKVIQSDIKFIYTPNFEMMTTIRTPFEGYRFMSSSYLVDITAPEYKVEGKMNIGSGQEYIFTSAFEDSSDKTGHATLETPITGFNKVGISFHHSGNAQKFSTQGFLTYADSKTISGKVNFDSYKMRFMSASAELNTPFTGFESTKMDAGFRSRSNMMTANTGVQYSNGKKIDANMRLVYTPNFDFQMRLSTPYKAMRSFRANADAALTAPNYAASGSVIYNRQAYKAAGKLNMFSLDKLDASLDLSSPMESGKIEYEHKVDASSINGKTSVTYGSESKVISAELQTTLSPTFDTKLTLRSPFAGYRSIEAAATYENSYKKYEGSAGLKVEGNELFSVVSGLDMSVEPLKVFAKMTNPIPASFELSHQGGFTNFKTVSSLVSPLTKSVQANAEFDFTSPLDMSLSASLKSALPGFDNLKLELQTSDDSDVKKVSASAGWTDGKQITAEGSLRQQKQGWYGNAASTAGVEFSLTTPFAPLSSLAVNAEGSHAEKAADAKLSFEMNGAQLLDVNGEIKDAPRAQVALNFRKPRNMQFTASGSNKDIDLYANWNTDVSDANVRVLAAVDQKDMSLTVETASRKMGASHSLEKTSRKINSAGRIFWASGADKQVSYSMSLEDSSRRNKGMKDATLKLALPSRTLEWTAALSSSAAAKTADGTFKWDADRDEEQRVGVKATMARGDKLRGDVTLSLPALQKELRVDGELLLNDGRVMLDAKTDFSYSKDARKTVTVVSKVQDLSSKGASNYSVELGLSHPATAVDVQLKSHLGRSASRLSLGLGGSYMTAQRKTKTMQLLAQINKLKKQISLQMFSPMNVEIVGDIVSDNKLRLVKNVDNVEVFRSEMAFDAKKKFEISTEVNADRVSLVAEYPNKRQFRAGMTYVPARGPAVDEALMALTLNSSRLLHSRVAWNPHMLAEVASAVQRQSVAAAYSFMDSWGLANQALEEEFTAKHSAIASELTQELSPLVDALERQLNNAARHMYDMSLSRDVIAAYRRGAGNLVTSLRARLAAVSAFPARERYTEYVQARQVEMLVGVQNAAAAANSAVQSLVEALQHAKAQLQGKAEEMTNLVYDNSYVNKAQDLLNQAKNFDVAPYLSRFSVPEVSVPEHLEPLVETAKDAGLEGLKNLWARRELDGVRGNLESIYAQAAAATKHYDAERSLEENIEAAIKLVVEIVEEELKALAAAGEQKHSPVTYYNPAQGELQAQFDLPIDLKNLQSMPDMSPLEAKAKLAAQKVELVAKKVEAAAGKVAKYLPDQQTWDSIKESVAAYLPAPAPAPVETQLQKDLTDFKPAKIAKKYKNKGGRKNKKTKKVKQM